VLKTLEALKGLADVGRVRSVSGGFSAPRATPRARAVTHTRVRVHVTSRLNVTGVRLAGVSSSLSAIPAAETLRDIKVPLLYYYFNNPEAIRRKMM